MRSRPRRCATQFVAIALFGLSNTLVAADEPVTYSLDLILPSLSVSESQKIAQQTPIAVLNNHVYIVNIEPGESGDEDGVSLHTIIRRGVEDASGQWSWSEKTLETRTIYDTWHTSPAIGTDRSGYIHVAYNMHNMPWQYTVSDQPDSIGSFTFVGDELSLEDIKVVKFDNRTSFKTMGYAAIPGNQITYPAFYNNTAGDLFVTYRFAAKPARRFEDRTMSGGIARFDNTERTWQSTGGDLNSARKDYDTSWFKKDIEPLAIASQTGWTVYHPRLAFDGDNRAYIAFYWREGVAGETLIKPCLITTTDFQQFSTLEGEAVNLPMTAQDCSNISTEMASNSEYNTIGSIAAAQGGSLYMIVSPATGDRQLLTFRQGEWSSESSPDEATEVFVDKGDNLWAMSSGLNVFRRSADSNDWQQVINADDRTACYPKVTLNDDKSIAYVYSQSCDEPNTVAVHKLDLMPR